VIHVVSKDPKQFSSGFAIARHEPSHEEDSLAAPAWELQPPFREVAVWSPKKYGERTTGNYKNVENQSGISGVENFRENPYNSS